MAASVEVGLEGGIAVLRLAAPPGNALAAPLRIALLGALDALRREPRARAAILTGGPRMFSSGLDVRELDAPPEGPTAAALAAAIETSPVPILALLDGPALGPGAELALAARWRLAGAGGAMGFPDLALGLIPGAGGTQRLPRLAGVEAALDLLLSRRPAGVEALRRLGLADGVVSGDSLAGARAFLADRLARGAPPPPPVRDRRHRLEDGVAALLALRAAREGRKGSERDLLDCLEAALLLPFPQGLAFEAERHADSLARPEARALRHLFLAERRASPALLRRLPDGTREVGPGGEAALDRLGRALGTAAGALVRRGVPREVVDAALVDWGMPAGPFGGTAGGAGPEGPRLVRRINAAVAAEGARLLAEGGVAPGDVDALAVLGLGLPRASGGPLAMAEAQGLAALCRDMEGWAAEDPVWAVPDPLRAAARAGAWSPREAA